MCARILAGSLLVLLAVSAASAQPLGTAFTYQGRLETAAGPVNGVHDLRFRLYDVLTGGAPLGATVCVDNVNVADGLVSQSLDFGGQFNGQERFLEIDVRADTGRDCTNAAEFVILTPRQPLNATPYALQTRGLFVDNVGRVGIGTTTPVALLNIDGGLILNDVLDEDVAFSTGNFYISNGDTQDPAYHYQSDPEQHEFFVGGGLAMKITSNGDVGVGAATPLARVHAQTASSTGRGVYGLATATTGAAYGAFFQSNSSSGIGVVGSANAASGSAYGVYGQSTSTSGRGVSGFATAASGDTSGVYGQSASPSGSGVYGRASAVTGINYGVYGESESSGGRGVHGAANFGTGIYGESTFADGVYGIGHYGGRFESASNGTGVSGTGYVGVRGSGFIGGEFESTTCVGIGVKGVATCGTDLATGVVGESHSVSGRGVTGRAVASTGTNNGVYGTSASPSGRGVHGASTDNIGVFGEADGATGSNFGVYGESASTSGVGVNGVATAATGTNYGVRGATASGSGWGVYSSGNFGASGTKAFRIDHPDEPANKYLLHYCAESPEVINFYSGKVLLDATGAAVVELPHYFGKINKDPRYTLTAVGAPMPMLHVAEEIDEASLSVGGRAEPGEAAPICSFRIAGGVPSAKVSWRVEAVRNDRWMQQRGAPVEVEKQDLEKGTYQHPELYGQPPEKGMNYDAGRAERGPSPEPAAPE